MIVNYQLMIKKLRKMNKISYKQKKLMKKYWKKI